MPNVLFAAPILDWDAYEKPLHDALEQAGVINALVSTELSPAETDYIIYAPDGPISDFSPYTRARAVLSLWAGVESIVGNPTLTHPVARMVDSGLTEGMVEWVTGHVMRHHLGLDRHILRKDAVWQPVMPPLARHRNVGILGLGALGSACATALAGLNFNVTGWSRRQKDLPGIRCLSGEEGLTETLRRSEILVLLLPHTAETEALLNAQRLATLPKGAVVLNPGRGALIDDAALLAALDSGQLGHATLDVFREEPLPSTHPFWAHPRVTVTPHIASATRPETASQVIAENIRRAEAGEPLLYLVDRESGY